MILVFQILGGIGDVDLSSSHAGVGGGMHNYSASTGYEMGPPGVGYPSFLS